MSTLSSVIATPYLMQWFAGHFMPVDAIALLRSILTVIIVPVGLGVALHRLAGHRVQEVAEVMPVLSVVVIVILVACVVALSRPQIVATGWRTVLAVILHNALGLAVGYGVAKLAGLDVVRRRAIALEVGMQNAGLAVALALSHFAAQPLVGLPAAIFGVWSTLSGTALASYWSRRRACSGAAVAAS